MSNESQEQTVERAESEAQTLLRRILGVLGYDAVEQLTAQDVASVIGAWLGLVQLVTADPTSPVADLWGRIYDASLRASPLLTRTARSEEARESADEAMTAYVRRFPPRFEPVDRQSLDDLAAMRAALDEQTEVSDRWRERTEKAERDLSAAQAALAEIAHIYIVPKPKPERVEPGQRWAFVMKADDSEEVSADCSFLFRDAYGEPWQAGPCDMKAAYYLGPAPTSEG